MTVFLADEQDDPLPLEQMHRLAESVLEVEGLPDLTDVTIMFVDVEQMTRYNEHFMKRDGPTDVLAFPLVQLKPGSYPTPDPHGPPLSLGDVIIAPAYVRNQAENRGTTFEDELALMVVHGILHLLGYDHQTDEDAAVMEAREAELLARAGRERP